MYYINLTRINLCRRWVQHASFGKSISIYESTWHHIPEKNNLPSHRLGNLKSHKVSLKEHKKQGLITDIHFSICPHSLMYRVTASRYTMGHTQLAVRI